MTTFSIIIPCFNAASTLGQTLDAITAQTFTDWEALCIDDGSNDATRDLICTYAKSDPRIRLLTNDGKGPSRARNLAGLQAAVGDIFAFCDADDIWTPQKLTQLHGAFADRSTDAAFGQIAFFDHSIDVISTYSSVPATPVTIRMLLGENPVCTMSNVAVRGHVFRAMGGFDERMVHNEDLDWLIRLVGGGACVRGLDALHTYYRASPSGLSADLPAMQAGRAAAVRTARRFGHNPTRTEEAIYARYLARRALRLGHGRTQALRLALGGICTSPWGFFNVPRRGCFTLLAALTCPFLPTNLSRKLFA
ncbi:glycosyltransferase family 2 protein [Pseudooctadecabacter jejudonensis]|uniref:UDP-Glc:alpha-D-GlcNAc-diphosphoundecaprenol beta-1,3-glucosyltransferase WfgD n=1 Tax=Pseudooctadecabacter jejudonensis TaxID=1391910 RepID=A0A1Y5RYN5_9RHOB|nr:glycosyltransferase family 2 protein [Pseudooctadecabacter jejudonensis]SLN27491.1 UDP-Glc:alpha-D-GlcNAc-diphosphoundecaprenol beta-1,3-glucosyltransferase WfgD [Pseudooctadecabacter jejudonensis]